MISLAFGRRPLKPAKYGRARQLAGAADWQLAIGNWQLAIGKSEGRIFGENPLQ